MPRLSDFATLWETSCLPLLRKLRSCSHPLQLRSLASGLARRTTPAQTILIRKSSLFSEGPLKANDNSNVGALAELVDITCIVNKPDFEAVQDAIFDEWSHHSHISTSEVINRLSVLYSPIVLGQHYFIPNPTTGVGLSPKWDFTSAAFAGNPNAYEVGAKAGDVPAPTGGNDIDWLSLNGVEGELATQIFRVATKGGKASASVSPFPCESKKT
jgi:hypothetical protein